jgi:cytochrome P450
VMTIFMAGHETTATSLAWTLNLLDANPSATARLRGELNAVLGDRKPAFADLPRLPYLKMCLEESMRLRPPVWSYSRMAAGPDRLGETDIPKGGLILLCNYAMHRDPRYWTEPDAFRPERFSQEESEKRPRYAYFPFGGGPRVCIGNGMAMMEGELVLACLLRAFDFRMAPGRAAEMNPLVTLRPKGGMWMAPSPVEAPVLTP